MSAPRLAGILLLVLAGCALPGRGPSRASGPGVLVGGRPAGGIAATVHPGFWQAVAELDLRAAERRAPDGEHRGFVRAVRQLLDGRMEEAEGPLTALSAGARDSVLRSASRVALSAALEYQGKWAALDELARGGGSASSRPGHEEASIEAWAAAMRLAPAPAYDFPPVPVMLPFVPASTGTPIVSVRVNGTPRWFWVDTGSSVTLIASDVAAQAGVERLAPDTLRMVTAVGVTGASPAVIRRLEIGGLRIDGQSAAIVDARDLTLDSGRATGEAGIARIDGVIGMDVIRRLNLEIDFFRRRLRISRPRPPQHLAERNLLWLGSPVVRIEQPDGRPLYFGLDTGADRTYATEGLLRKLPRRRLPRQRQVLAGFGGDTLVSVPTLPDLDVTIADRRFFLNEVAVHAPRQLTFLQLDGVIGTDTAAGLVMRIDMTNGVFGISLMLT